MSEATYKKITLNGETHILKFDFNAIAELEEYYGKGILGIVNEDTAGLNTIRNIYWAGMLWKNPNLKNFHVGRMLAEEIETSEEFDMDKHMETAIQALYGSKVFQVIAKQYQPKEEKIEKKASKKEKN